MMQAFNYLTKLKQVSLIPKEPEHIPSFLTWCKSVSPQYDFTYDWIVYVEKEQQAHDFILFSIPPQHGKSTVFTIHKAAYFLRFYPDQRGIIISYNSEITSRFHREILRLLEKENVPLYSKSQKEIVHANLVGSISFCGFQGGITSKPANWIIIDDPIKSAADAYSPSYQNTLKLGFATSIIPRLQQNFKLYATQTRWHDKDLIGQILALNHELNANLNLKYINLPAICDSDDDPLGRKIGEVLCPQRFTLESIKTKMLIAEGDAYALYQGRPAPPEGAMFKSEDLETQTFIDLNDIPKNCINFLSVDCGFKETDTSDFVAIGCYSFDFKSGILFKTKCINERADFDKTLNLTKNNFLETKSQFALIEDKANGSAIINVLDKLYPGQFIAVNPDGGKVARAYAAQPFIKTKRFKIFKNMPNYQDYINQLKTFPKAAHDDMVDETTQAINYVVEQFSVMDYSKINEGFEAIQDVRF